MGAAPAARFGHQFNYVGPATPKGLLMPASTWPSATPWAWACREGLTIYQTNATPASIIGRRHLHLGAHCQWEQRLGPAGQRRYQPATDFVGTTDGQPLVFRTNATERGRLDIDGDLGVGWLTLRSAGRGWGDPPARHLHRQRRGHDPLERGVAPP